jgi:hypothetical protein
MLLLAVGHSVVSLRPSLVSWPYSAILQLIGDTAHEKGALDWQGALRDYGDGSRRVGHAAVVGTAERK